MSNDKREQDGLRKFSRRDLLKMIGVAGLGTVAAKVALPPAVIHAIAKDQGELEKVRSIVSESLLYNTALDELTGQGFDFDLEAGNFSRYDKDPRIVGIALSNVKDVPHSPTGATLSLSINLETSSLYALEYVIGRSQAKGLQIQRTTLLVPESADGTLQRIHDEQLYLREEEDIASSKTSEQDPQLDSTESCNYLYTYKECTPWYYDSCCNVQWCVCCYGIGGCSTMLRCTCNREYRNCRDCIHYANCPDSCGSWYSEWRNVEVGCSGIGCNP